MTTITWETSSTMKSALHTSPLMSLLHVMSCLPRSHPQHYVCVLPGLALPDSHLFLCSLTAEDEIKDGVRTSRGKQLHTPRWLHAQSPLLQQVIILLLSQIHGPIAHLLHNRLIAELHWLYDTCRGDLFEINAAWVFFCFFFSPCELQCWVGTWQRDTGSCATSLVLWRRKRRRKKTCHGSSCRWFWKEQGRRVERCRCQLAPRWLAAIDLLQTAWFFSFFLKD